MAPTLPFDSGRARRNPIARVDVAEALLVGNTACVACRRGLIGCLGTRCVPVVQVRHQRGVAIGAEGARDLLRGAVVAGHVVQHHDARLVVTFEWSGEVRLELVAVVACDRGRLGDHRVGHGCILPPVARPQTPARASDNVRCWDRLTDRRGP